MSVQVRLYYAATPRFWQFEALGVAQRLAGLSGAIAHTALLTDHGREISAYSWRPEWPPWRGVVAECLPYDLPSEVRTVPDADGEKAIWFARQQLGQRYDWAAIWHLGWARRLGRRTGSLTPGAWICASITGGAIRAAGANPWGDLDTALLAPADFLVL